MRYRVLKWLVRALAWSIGTFVIGWAAFCLLYVFFFERRIYWQAVPVVLYGAGAFIVAAAIDVLIDIEENTRQSASLLRELLRSKHLTDRGDADVDIRQTRGPADPVDEHIQLRRAANSNDPSEPEA